MRLIFVTAVLLTLSSPALAQQAERCTEAEDLIKAMTTLPSFDADMTSPVKMKLQLRAEQEGAPVTDQRFFYRDGVEIIELPLSADGVLQDTHKMSSKNQEAELCRASLDDSDTSENISMNAQMTFDYAPGGGTYDVATLEEGAKEGRNQLKALAPAAVRLLVPKLTHIVVSAPDESGPLPVVTTLVDGEPRAAFKPTVMEEQRIMIALSDLKKHKIDEIKITGGSYLLQASMKPDDN